MTGLTKMQRDMLTLLSYQNHRLDAKDLYSALYLNHYTEQSAVVTASSLVRRGLAEKEEVAGRMTYRITQDGRQVLAA